MPEDKLSAYDQPPFKPCWLSDLHEKHEVHTLVFCLCQHLSDIRASVVHPTEGLEVIIMPATIGGTPATVSSTTALCPYLDAKKVSAVHLKV